MSNTLTQCDPHECRTETAAARPRADIYEIDDAWLLVLEMPGVDEHGTDVSCEKNVLTVSGVADVFDTDGFDRQFGEVGPKSFRRSFRLPEEVDATNIEAHVKNGVLRVRLPKAEAALPQKVVVKAG